MSLESLKNSKKNELNGLYYGATSVTYNGQIIHKGETPSMLAALSSYEGKTLSSYGFLVFNNGQGTGERGIVSFSNLADLKDLANKVFYHFNNVDLYYVTKLNEINSADNEASLSAMDFNDFPVFQP